MRQLRTIIAACGIFLSTLLVSVDVLAEPQLNGLAIHNELGKEQFIAGLFADTLSKDSTSILLASEEKRIQIKVLARRISSRSFKRMWIEGMAINASPKELAKHSQNMATFSNMLKIRLVSGDIFSVDRSLEEVTVSLNGVILGVINDVKFFDLLLRTWIGPVPLSSEFRTSLLKKGKLKSDISSRFNSIRPENDRIEAIAALAAGQKEKQSESDAKKVAAIAAPVAAVPAPNIPKVAAPKIELAAEAPKVELAAPKPEPKKAQPTPKPKPAVVASTPAPAEKKEKPAQVALLEAPKESDDLLDELFFDEDEDDIEFTAAGMLAQSLYISNLKRWTNKHIRYPKRALKRGWEGNVRLSITVNRDGSVKGVVVTEEAPYEELTEAALKAVKDADPYPVMPEDVNGDNFQFTLPVVFVLK